MTRLSDKWVCMFCGSRGWSAFWSWRTSGSRKLHPCHKGDIKDPRAFLLYAWVGGGLAVCAAFIVIAKVLG